MLFSLGQIVATPGALDLFERNRAEIVLYLLRHQGGDWGNLDREDTEANDYAVDHDLRILSAYEIDNEKFWIITEWDRSYTTILLPDEY